MHTVVSKRGTQLSANARLLMWLGTDTREAAALDEGAADPSFTGGVPW